jgi:hypothetical protein
MFFRTQSGYSRKDELCPRHECDCGRHDLVQLRLPDRQVSILTIRITAAMIWNSSDFQTDK